MHCPSGALCSALSLLGTCALPFWGTVFCTVPLGYLRTALLGHCVMCTSWALVHCALHCPFGALPFLGSVLCTAIFGALPLWGTLFCTVPLGYLCTALLATVFCTALFWGAALLGHYVLIFPLDYDLHCPCGIVCPALPLLGHCILHCPSWALCSAFLGHCGLYYPSGAMCSTLALWGTVLCTAPLGLV